jgi:RimJ/RimL family protein N-acetyltransferase
MSVPELRTARLLLRGVTERDEPSYRKHFVDYEVIRHLSAVVPWPYPENGVRDFIRDVILPQQGKDKWVWGIFRHEAPGELIGVVDLWRPGHPENRGFWLGRAFWGQGLMTEAIRPVTDLAFSTLGFEKLVFANAAGNVRSRRIKEKTGARLIGVFPGKFVDPAYTEREVWEITPSEWIAFAGHPSTVRG